MKTLTRLSTGKMVIIGLIMTNLVFAIMILITIPTTSNFAGGMDILDMKPGGYSMDYILMLFELLGDEGRAFYLTRQLPIDFIYPGLFALSGVINFIYLLKKLYPTQLSLNWILVFPIIAGVADYFENIGIIVMLNTFPALHEGVAQTTSILSITKSTSSTFYWVAFLILIGIWIARRLKKNRI